MKNSYDSNVSLQCATCGSENFDFNDDKSYVKCNSCNREYLGGREELVKYNHPQINNIVQRQANEIAKDFKNDLIKAFSGSKFIKIK